MKNLFLPSLFILLMLSFPMVWGQNNSTKDVIECQTSEAVKQYFGQNPQELIEYQKFNKYTRDFVKDIANKKSNMPSTYTLPVVFHVYGMQQSGKTVDYNTIVNSLNQVNDDFNGLNDDFNSIDPIYDGIKAVLDIEFKLAKIDPNGNCTTGVIFYPVESGIGNYNSSVVARDGWDNYKYINVYIAADVYGDGVFNNSGVAWYPMTSMSDLDIARIGYNGRYLTGNIDKEFSSILSHEFGHFLNLIHTHEDGCTGTDEVNDTPQDDQGNSGDCSETSDCGGSINYENYMGYNGSAGCYKMFTQGQINRMVAALSHPSRESLWQASNLTATGVNNQGGASVLSDAANVIESLANDGAITSTINITTINTTFSVSGNLTEGSHFNSTMPAGLVAQINVLNSTQAELTITGNATNHEEVNNQSISIEFLAAATNDSLECDSLGWNLYFLDPYDIIYVNNNDITANVINVWKPITDSFIPSLGTGTNFAGLFYNANHPSGQAGLQIETYTEAMVCDAGGLNVSMLPQNTLISTASNWVNGQVYPNLLDIRNTTYTTWDGLTNFAGFRFMKNGLQYHGWFRFEVAASGGSFTLLDYAYNTRPDGDIYTGQTLQLSVNSDSFQDYDLSVYPNPFNNSIYIDTGKLKGKKMMVEIRNILGQTLFSKTYNNVSSKISISNFSASAGVYFITVNTDNEKRMTKKIIKK